MSQEDQPSELYRAAMNAEFVPGSLTDLRQIMAETDNADQYWQAQQDAILLYRAGEIRADARRMAAVRAYLRDEKDRFAALLDEIG